MLLKTKSDLKAYYHERCMAYNRTFPENGPFSQQVLHDLAEFCRASESTFHPDARVHAVLEGRREVWLRIKEFLTMNADQLLEKKSRKVDLVEEEKPQTPRR